MVWHSKHDGSLSLISFPNSKCKNICQRCKKAIKDSKYNNRPRLINYYKNLCKGSRCLIHKETRSDSKINCKKNKCGKKLCKQKKIIRITEINGPCIVQEFEDDERNILDDIDPQSYLKIETTLTDFDSNEGNIEDIIGHSFLKQVIKRTIVCPFKKPEIFKGLRSAPKGILLFGPPGTGKTLIGQWIAFETKSTFFNISSSCLTSKWMGESEKLVRTMFVVAKARQPSVIFIDEVDGILSQRNCNENESSRRMKNEFFIHMDGSATVAEDRIMVVGATNRPQELDAAARRRFVKRLYIRLPDSSDRKELLRSLLKCECHCLEDSDVDEIVRKTEGYSVADLKNLSQEAAMGPIKALSVKSIIRLQPNRIRPISMDDFLYALQLIKPTVSKEELRAYEKWDSLYGYGNELKKN